MCLSEATKAVDTHASALSTRSNKFYTFLVNFRYTLTVWGSWNKELLALCVPFICSHFP